MTSLPHEKQRKEVKEMNTLVIVLIAAVCLFGAYTLYGRWLANKWGIDPTAKTPAVVHEDGRDYVPTNGWTVFAHQFSSIAGAGPVTGAIQAAAFGWLPVLLWVLLGGRTYDQIVKEVEISTATISRINRCIQYGTGGYQSVIEKISAQEKKQ